MQANALHYIHLFVEQTTMNTSLFWEENCITVELPVYFCITE